MPPARALFWAATLAGVIFSVRAAVVGPPPLLVAVAASVAYVAFFLAGVLVLRLRVFVDAVVRGPVGARGVALTFDDGPHPEHTRQVLATLEARGARATFFVIGRKADAHPDLVREIVRRGHAVGVHGYEHDRLFSLRRTRRVRRDLERSVEALERITGVRPVLFRPPIGHTNPVIARVADGLGLVVVGWSVSARDGIAGVRPEELVGRLRPGLADGAIVLLHDAAERDDRVPASIAALPMLMDAIEAQGLAIVPLESWTSDDEAPQGRKVTAGEEAGRP
jgi:peptidoglycan/xylan/chitin deacetylase (PgdA/CDA1 family)